MFALAQPASNHNGGHIAFGPDGYLHIGFGDGGGSGDTYENGQNTQSLHGTIIRVDVSGDTMTVPDDIPFVGDSAVLDEIYAYGLRNPWRYSFDNLTGDLWVGDVGQDNFEGIDVVKGGDNLGWPVMEGERCYDSSTCDMTGITLPVDVYNHVSGDCSVTGGYVYRGQSIPALQGRYIHGDFCTGTVRTVVKEADESYTSAVLLYSGLNIASFAQGADGEVLAVALSGQIYKFVDDGATSNIPAKLSGSGCFSSTQNKSYPDYVVPYDVVSKLWSDGEQKSRYFAIPDGTDITALDDGIDPLPVTVITSTTQSLLKGNVWTVTPVLPTDYWVLKPARWTLPLILTDSQLCEQSPNNGDLGITNAKIVALGDASRSVLVARMQTLYNDNRMPPMAGAVLMNRQSR